MKTIPLVNSTAKAIVDDEDYEYLILVSWQYEVVGATSSVYRSLCLPGGGKPLEAVVGLTMSQAIMGRAPDGMKWVHRDGNGLNNRKENFRAATAQQANAHKRKACGKASRFKGVVFHRRSRKWRARITVDGKLTSLGLFADEGSAAEAYDEAARKNFGEFASVNFPQPGECCCLLDRGGGRAA